MTPTHAVAHAPAGRTCTTHRRTHAAIARWCIYALGAALLTTGIDAAPVPAHGSTGAARAHHHAARNAAFSSSAAAIESDLLHSLKHPPRIGVLHDGKEVDGDGDSHARDMSDPMEKAMPRIAVPPSLSSSGASKPHSSGRRMHTKTHTRTTKTAGGRPSAAYRGSGSKSSGVIDDDDKLRRVIEDGAGVSLNADGFL